MPLQVPVDRFLAAGFPIIDVRSPGEFAHGHIPGAANLPLFTDEERAEVGTLYKQQGRKPAMLHGLRITGPKLAGLAEQASAIAPENSVAVHCWRGGERSASVAWLLEKAASMQVLTLQKGYKAFRQLVAESFNRPWNLRILGGYTGTGKTELLGLMRGMGAQVLDLEALARHKGSAFGGIGQAAQPSTEQFENLIWQALGQLDPRKPVWVEDESQMVGHAKVPDPFFAQMRKGAVAFVDLPQQRRAERLVADYGHCPGPELAAAIARIQKRLGPQHAKAALQALHGGDLLQVARTVLNYYDKTYARGLASRDPANVRLIPASGSSPDMIAEKLLEDER